MFDFAGAKVTFILAANINIIKGFNFSMLDSYPDPGGEMNADTCGSGSENTDLFRSMILRD